MGKDMRARATSMWVATLGVVLLAASGCGEPEPGATTRPRGATPATRPSGDRQVSSVVAPDDRPWHPGRGRLSEEVCRRHGLVASSLRRSGLGETVLWETFTNAKGATVPGWRRVGEPGVAVRADPVQGKWIQLTAPKRGSRCGLVHELPANDMAGQVVRLQIKALQLGAAGARPADLPKVQLEWTEKGGKTGTAPLRLQTRPSPGWEACETLTAIPEGVKDVKVSLIARGTSAAGGLDDVLVERIKPLAVARVAGTVGQRDNLIDGGDFEVGQRNFSVYGARRVPGRPNLWACPIAWAIDDTVAAGGKRSLRVPLVQEEFRVAFGWVRVVPGKDYVVSLFARSNTKVVLRIGVVEYPGVFRFDYFTIDQQFRRVALKVKLEPNIPWSAMAVVVRPSDRPADAYAKDPSHVLWLDRVSLTQGDPKTRYDPPAPVEVGIVGPGFEPTDVAHLVQTGEPARLTIRATNYQTSAWDGRLAIDVVDAFDRPIPSGTRTIKVSVAAGETTEQPLGGLALPRGYYKALVTAWPGLVGRGRPHSTAERAFGVVNLADPIPTGNYFGMTVESPRMSRRITQLGAGWVWLKAPPQWCETSDGKRQWSWYKALLDRAHKQRLEVLADLAWTGPGGKPPAPGEKWRAVCREFAIANKAEAGSAGKVDGLGVLDQAAIEGLEPGKYMALLGQASFEIRRTVAKVDVLGVASCELGSNPFAWLTQAMKGGALARAANGIALRFQSTPLPEDIEPALEQVRSWRGTDSFKQVIDVAVGRRGPGGYLHVPNLYGYRADEAASGPEVDDPVLHASRLVRALAIRQFAPIDRAAWWVESHRPPDILRPSADPQCHEYDNAPRPSLVAFDFMAEMLNPALLVEWIDLPQQMRALCFERSDKNMVVLIWRPFGWSLRPVGLKGMAGRVTVYDLFGRRERHPTRGGDLLVMVNEAVRYLFLPVAVKDQVLWALRQPIPVTSAPAASRPSPK